jgi:hypothetical protein
MNNNGPSKSVCRISTKSQEISKEDYTNILPANVGVIPISSSLGHLMLQSGLWY